MGSKVLGGAWKNRAALGAAVGTTSAVEYGGSYLEAIQHVKTDSDPTVSTPKSRSPPTTFKRPKSFSTSTQSRVKRTGAIASVEAMTMFVGGFAVKL